MRGRSIREVLAACVVAAALTAGCAPSALAVTQAPEPAQPDYDARAGDVADVPAATQDARDALAKRLGAQGDLAADPVTGGVRALGRTDGFLTAATATAAADPEAVALGYLRDHADAFGLDAADLATLRLRNRTTSPDGITHLVYEQVANGIPAYDSQFTANVTAGGQLINAGGAPVHGLSVPAATPPLGPAAARAAAQRDLGVAVDGDAGTIDTNNPTQDTTFANGDRAALVIVAGPDGDRLAWRLTVAGPPPYLYESVVDAASGAVLARHSLTDFLTSNAKVVRQRPGDGTLATVDIGAWLSSPVTGLKGPSVHAYPDRTFPNGIAGDAEIAPSAGNDFTFTTTPVAPVSGQSCPTNYGNVCTWDGVNASSSSTNLSQATTQVFFYTNRYHDWLAQPPISFTPSSFSFDNNSDPLNAETDDSVSYTSGQGNGAAFNNANMSTPPDGQSPTMQMYLWKAPYPAVNGADDATVVYHEYTHGLTNRLVGNDGLANGLIARQSQAMGEGWSDWYALDYLTESGEFTDDPNNPGDELIGAYVTNNPNTGIRYNAVDCRVSDRGPHCPGTPTAGPGGFTLGDMGKIASYAPTQSGDTRHPAFEVHADGEIWAETLWDVRQRLGDTDARALITSALRLMPKNPTFLEARDAILAADTAAGGADHAALWSVFANRGMGFSASITSANATHAHEAFDTPPVAQAGAPTTTSVPLEQLAAFTIPVVNPGTTALTHARATLAATTAGLTIVQGAADLGTIAVGAGKPAPFTLRVAATAGCGAVAGATLKITSDQGTTTVPVGFPIGSGTSGASTKSYNPVAPIADNAPGGGIVSQISVPTHGRVGAMRVTLAGTHSFIGDLHAWLTSPAGTTVDLMERPGTDTQNYFSGGNLVPATPLVFDDSAQNPIQELTAGDGTISGAYKPNEPLKAFAGEDRFGTWTLHLTDLQSGDTGSLTSWSLQTDDPACAITDAPGDLYDDHATFHARLDPGTATAATTAAFELGKTTTYGSRSPETAVTSTGLQDFAVATGGLTAGTTYHVRAILLRNGAVVATGADQSFVAGSQPAPPGDGGGGGTDDGGGTGDDGGGSHVTTTPPPPPETGGAGMTTFLVPKATMKSLVRTLRLDKKGRFTLSFRATPAKAKGSVKVLVGKSSAGTAKFTVPSSGRVKITIKATKKLLSALKHKSSAKTKATLKIGVTSFTATLTIKPYKKPKAKH